MSDNSTDRTAGLPDLNLTAAGSGREVNLAQIGVPTILIFHGQDTADAALEINKAVRKQFPTAGEVFVASVIDLRSFPSMFRSMVTPALEKAYFNAAGKVPDEADPADLVVLLPDWDGSVHDTVEVQDSTDKAAVMVADDQGRIVCHDQNDNLAETALAALSNLMGN